MQRFKRGFLNKISLYILSYNLHPKSFSSCNLNLTKEYFNPMQKCINRIRKVPLSLYHENIKFMTTYSAPKISPVQMAYTSFKATSTKNLQSAPPVMIMHGLLGSKTNWKSLGKALNQQTGRTIYTVDARNHGESPHTEDFSYYSLAEDIVYFLRQHSLSKACLMGHSMGGRAVMTVALMHPEVVEKLIVLDISPVSVSENISTLPRFVEIMRKVQIPSTLELPGARKYVDGLLQPIIPETGIRLFLLANLMKREGQFFWKVNLDAIGKKFNPHISTFPPAKNGRIFEGETHFIGGAQSNYINPDDYTEIRKLFPSATFSHIQGAGHWLHADKPHEFLKTVTPLINS